MFYCSIFDNDVLFSLKNFRLFFFVGLLVLDYFWGDLMLVVDLLIREEFLVVMYYVSWCYDFIRVKVEFIKVVKVLENKVRN